MPRRALLALVAALTAGCASVPDFVPAPTRADSAATDEAADVTIGDSSPSNTETSADATDATIVDGNDSSSDDTATADSSDAASDAMDVIDPSVDAMADTTSDGADTFDALPADASPCTFPATATQPCGRCGTQTRTCFSPGYWGAWTACRGEKAGSVACIVGDTRSAPCGKCGSRSEACDPVACMWNTSAACTGEGVCTAGATEASTAITCADYETTPRRACTSSCSWASPTCEPNKGWHSIATTPASFVGRVYSTTVWTGTDAIVFGGQGRTATLVRPGDGARYNLATNRWTMLPSVPSTLPSLHRAFHSAVWTGLQMIVWGGENLEGSTVSSRNDGARYDLATDSWRAMASSPLSARMNHFAYWSSSTNQMIVWGQSSTATTIEQDDGAAYNPTTDTWTKLPASPLARTGTSAAWTGSRLFIWGGTDLSFSTTFTDGAILDLASGTWTSVPTTPSGFPARMNEVTLFSGTDYYVWGGQTTPTNAWTATGVRYPSSGGWITMPTLDASVLLPPNPSFPAAWFGAGRFWVWSGGDSSGAMIFGGASFDPITNVWTAMDDTGAPSPRSNANVVWTGKSAIIYGGWLKSSGIASDGAIFTP